MDEESENRAMRIINNVFWIYYLSDKDPQFDPNKVGKWMYFFSDRNFMEKMCKEAIEEGIVQECKHSNANDGVSCFYLNDDDFEGHKKVISFFLKNKLIRKTKTGRLYNISFKHDEQTEAGDYGKNYHSDIKLNQFIDLETGGWK
ncbi:hypothetical protein [Lactobacillus corticis]|nr:hypothetical protein [Lactobacillus corticis]